MIDDVIVVGAGPAGAVAATLLARAGARVRLLDRARFPRDKLCGDTINPGALGELRRLGLAAPVEAAGLRVDGMRLTGPTGVAVEGRYPGGLHGRALLRRDLDWALVGQAVAAGVRFEPGVTVRGPLVAGGSGEPSITGVIVRALGAVQTLRAPITIAADGRRSTIGFALGLARHPARPRRWAIGAYYQDVHGLSALGEMHVRRGRYIGVAPVPGGLANVCLVQSFEAPGGPSPARLSLRLLADELARDRWLRDRFADARMARTPVVLGPLAVETAGVGLPGLLLAGDAAGFIDPITGDGLRFAVRGASLAADAALDALTHGWDPGVARRLAADRRSEFASKWRFNRALRVIVDHPAMVQGGAVGARLFPGVFRSVIRAAGDCRAAALQYR